MTQTNNPWKEANDRYDRIRKAESEYLRSREEQKREQQIIEDLKCRGLYCPSTELNLETHC